MIRNRRQTLLWYSAGICLLVIAFFSPHPGYLNGESFFTVAQSTTWDKWWDWAAAWCSLKVILVSVGVFLMLFALGDFLTFSALRTLGRIVLTLTGAPIAVFGIGLYYLIKSVF